MSIAETERTVIDRIRIDDAPFFVSLLNSPGWLRFIGDRRVSDVSDARKFLESGLLKSYRDNEFGYYLVRTISNREPIGICGFMKKPYLDNPDFGFALMPEHQDRGYALESCRAVLDYGIRNFEFTMLDAVTCPDNERSIQLLEKLEFQREGLLDEDAEDSLVLFRWHSQRSCDK